jgi:hypothetical protein
MYEVQIYVLNSAVAIIRMAEGNICLSDTDTLRFIICSK